MGVASQSGLHAELTPPKRSDNEAAVDFASAMSDVFEESVAPGDAAARTGVSLPRRKVVRRKQSDRSAETREKVIQAAIDCIAELGFRKATTNRIAARADVSWGAVQHHFGDKDAILEALIEREFQDLVDEIADLQKIRRPLEERVAAFTERASWGDRT